MNKKFLLIAASFLIVSCHLFAQDFSDVTIEEVEVTPTIFYLKGR